MRAAYRKARVGWVALALFALVAGTGCVGGPRVVPLEDQKPVDRAQVESPAGTALLIEVEGLTAPTAIAFDNEGEHKGTIIVAEGGVGGHSVRVVGIRPDRTLFQIYPQGQTIPFFHRGFQMHAPIGGMVVHQGKIIVSHRDGDGNGVITALGYDGSHSTIVADLPAQGDHSVTDVAVNPVNGRIYFGLGTATNSGIVGLDNWAVGWVNDHPQFCDIPLVSLKLLGFRFDTKNPRAGLFGGADIAVTGAMQPFNTSNQTRIRAAANGKPTGAIYSISPSGGDLRVEAHGIRHPRGLAFNEYGNLYFTNNGMEMRGTRPVKDDPDVLLRLSPGALGSVPGYGWPDFSADLYPIGESRFQPPEEQILKSGYPELSALIDHQASGLVPPDQFRSTLLFGVFRSQSGAAKAAFVPGTGPFKSMQGNVIVALSGDRAPFATSGRELIGPIGFKVMRVDVDITKREVHEFIRNTSGVPASMTDGGSVALERPCDVKFGPDGALYIVDMGRMTVVNGKERVASGTGRVFKLVPLEWTIPSTTQSLVTSSDR